MHVLDVIERLADEVARGITADTEAVVRGVKQEDYWRLLGSIQRSRQVERVIKELSHKLNGGDNHE